MTPALLFGPLLVGHVLATTAHSALPQKHLRRGTVTVDAVAKPRTDGTADGRLDVRTGGQRQSIMLRPRAVGAEMLASSVQLVDANFDGHPDIVVLREFGAKWAASDVYLFDARTRRFSDTSPLARALAHLANLRFDTRHRRVISYDIGPNRPSREVYDVVGTGLRLTESCIFLNDGDEHVGTLVRSRLTGGAMHSTYTKLQLGPVDLAPCGP